VHFVFGSLAAWAKMGIELVTARIGGLPSLALGAEGCTAMVAARLMMQNPAPRHRNH
jgi:hypothetical protein